MKLLVPVKPDRNERSSAFCDPLDDVAVDFAVKHRHAGDSVVVLVFAGATASQLMARQALSRGADRVIVATGSANTRDPGPLSDAVRTLTADENFDLIIYSESCQAKRPGAMPVALDGHAVTSGKPGGIATNSMIAFGKGAMDFGGINGVTAVEHAPQNGKVRVTREIDVSSSKRVRQYIELSLPARIVIRTVGTFPEILSLYAIAGSRDKEVEILDMSNHVTPVREEGRTAAVCESVEFTPGRMASVDELVNALRREGLLGDGPVPLAGGDLPAGATLLASEEIPAPSSDMANSRIVVAGGRSLGDAETFDKYIGGLARALGAAVAASGGAVHSGIAPMSQLVGQTGQTIAPDLYIAIGISGADQHVGGMQDSRIIVAINEDPEAPIFRIAHYGLVGDFRSVVPELISCLELVLR